MKRNIYCFTSLAILVVVFLTLGVACKQTGESSATSPSPTATEKGDLDRAIAGCDQAIAPDSQDAQAYYNRGVICAQSGDLEGAMRDFDKAIELNPDYGAAYHDRGNTYGAMGDLEQAIRDHDRAIELDPDNAHAYYSRGLDYANAGDLEQAIRDFTQAIALNPNHAAAYYDRGITFRDSGDLARAIRDYDKAIELNPDYVLAYYHRGNAYYEKGDLDPAIADYDQVIALAPQFAQAYIMRAAVYAEVGEREKAISDLERASELDLEPGLEQTVQALLEELRGSSQSFDGDYWGTTSQGKEFELVIEDNGIRFVLVGFDIPGCESYSPMSTYHGQVEDFITGNEFSLASAELVITGTFSSSTSASGTMEIKPAICEGSVHVTWNVGK